MTAILKITAKKLKPFLMFLGIIQCHAKFQCRQWSNQILRKLFSEQNEIISLGENHAILYTRPN